MEFKSNTKIAKRNFILLLIISICFSIFTAILFISDTETPDPVFYGTLIGVCVFAWLLTLALGIRAKSINYLKFEKDAITVNGTKIPVSEIQHVKISASLGTMKPIKPQYANIDLMVTLPPEKGLYGTIKVIASHEHFTLAPIEDVMTAYTFFRKLGCDVEATYALGEKMRKYIWGDVS